MARRGQGEIKSNLILTLRDERGKLVTRRKGHNIWLNVGRAWLANLITYATLDPDSYAVITRPRYMGFGIGGSKQSYLGLVGAAPYSTQYPGTNVQVDTDVSSSRLERPVRISWTTGSPTTPSGTYPSLTYDAGDVFLKQFSTTPTHPSATSRQFTCILGPSDISSGPYLGVPLSEIGMFLHGVSVNQYAPSPVAYDTFDSIQKTNLFTLEVDWTVRF